MSRVGSIYKPISNALNPSNVSASSATDIWTVTDHGLTNNDIVRINSVLIGSGPVLETPYWVGDVTQHTYKLYTNSSKSTVLNIISDILNADVWIANQELPTASSWQNFDLVESTILVDNLNFYLVQIYLSLFLYCLLAYLLIWLLA